MEHLRSPREGRRLHRTIAPYPWRAPCFPTLGGAPTVAPSPAPPLRLLPGALGPFRRTIQRRAGGSSAPSAPPALVPAPRAAPGRFPPRSRPPAAGTRVAAYKRGGARASPPLPAAERTARSGGSLVPRHPSAPRTHHPRPQEPVRRGAGERGRKRGPRAADPRVGSRIAPGKGRGGASARTGEPGGPRRSLGWTGSRAGRSRPACGAWAAEEPPGRVWAPAAGMSLTGRRGWRGRRAPPRPPPQPGRGLALPLQAAAGGAGAP